MGESMSRRFSPRSLHVSHAKLKFAYSYAIFFKYFFFLEKKNIFITKKTDQHNATPTDPVDQKPKQTKEQKQTPPKGS